MIDLPAELIDLVLHHLPPSRYKASSPYHHTCLISRTWLIPSRRQLFRTFSVPENEHDDALWLPRLLFHVLHPHIAQYIQVLKITRLMFVSVENDLHTWTGKLLRIFPNLSELVVSLDANLMMEGGRVRMLLIRLFDLRPQWTRIHIHLMPWRSGLSSDIGAGWPDMLTYILDDDDIKRTRLKALTLGGCDIELLQIMMRYAIELIKSESVHVLRLNYMNFATPSDWRICATIHGLVSQFVNLKEIELCYPIFNSATTHWLPKDLIPDHPLNLAHLTTLRVHCFLDEYHHHLLYALLHKSFFPSLSHLEITALATHIIWDVDLARYLSTENPAGPAPEGEPPPQRNPEFEGLERFPCVLSDEIQRNVKHVQVEFKQCCVYHASRMFHGSKEFLGLFGVAHEPRGVVEVKFPGKLKSA